MDWSRFDITRYLARPRTIYGHTAGIASHSRVSASPRQTRLSCRSDTPDAYLTGCTQCDCVSDSSVDPPILDEVCCLTPVVIPLLGTSRLEQQCRLTLARQARRFDHAPLVDVLLVRVPATISQVHVLGCPERLSRHRVTSLGVIIGRSSVSSRM